MQHSYEVGSQKDSGVKGSLQAGVQHSYEVGPQKE